MFTQRKTFGGRSGGRRSGPGGRRSDSSGPGGRSYGPGRGGSSDARGGGRDFQEGREGRGGGKFFRKKVCRFCEEQIPAIDFKEVDRLSKFLTEKGKIIPQRISGNCAPHQRRLSAAVKRARHAALVPFQAA